ncbi:MAG: proC, partial [Firmicutes bacterium]|nr:proC [Bacillota bacterium]
MLKDKKISFIGGGAMAEALIRGLVAAELVEAGQISVSDVSKDRLAYLADNYKVATTYDSLSVVRQADILILAVKPQVIQGVLDEISGAVSRNTVTISIAAGITLAVLEEKLSGVPIIRVMPNTPVAVSAGMSAIALGKAATPDMGELALSIFSSVGRAVVVSENAMDAVTGLSGSGPAFAYVLI